MCMYVRTCGGHSTYVHMRLLTEADYACPQMPAEECIARIELSYICSMCSGEVSRLVQSDSSHHVLYVLNLHTGRVASRWMLSQKLVIDMSSIFVTQACH